MPLCSTSAAATSSWVDSGFEAQSATSAPPAAASASGWRSRSSRAGTRAIRMPSSGRSFSNRSRISASTGISAPAHSMRSRPAAASADVAHVVRHQISPRSREARQQVDEEPPDRDRGLVRDAHDLLVLHVFAEGVRQLQMPSTRMPRAAAGSASGTIDMPTTVAPADRSSATSVGVSYAGPLIAA